jgi:hypothetical protein
LWTNLSLKLPWPLLSFVWTRTSAKPSRNSSNINCTKRYKCPHHTRPVSMMGSPSHKGSPFSMLTKFFTCLFCLQKQRRRCFRYSAEPYGHRIKPASQAWHLMPVAFGVKKLGPWNICYTAVKTTRPRFGS